MIGDPVYEQQVRAALKAVVVQPPAGISWRGRRKILVPPRLCPVLEPEAAGRLFRRGLQWTFYSEFYCTGAAIRRPLCAEAPTAVAQPFVDALTRANCGEGCWDRGWTVVDATQDSVGRDGLEVRLGDADRRASAGGAAEIELRLPKELSGALPGYHLVLGDTALRPSHDQRGVRVYWNVTARGAIALVRAATAVLNRENIAFRLKILTDLACFRRCDSAVLYLAADDIHRVLPLLEPVYDGLDGGMLPGTPAFTLRLAPGLAMAESPPGGESFGLHRCELLAAGALEAHINGVRGLEDRVAVTARQFRAAGVEMARPYVDAGGRLFDDVQFAWGDRRRKGSLDGRSRARGSPRAFLKAAQRIGASLAETAIWEADRCTWIGVDGPLDPRSPPGGPSACSPIGGDLYSGTAGVSLFLAELATTTGDAALARTALGAARHAIHAAAREDPAGGLYTGAMSAAFGAAYAGALLGDAGVAQTARGIAHAFRPSEAECDLLSGLAGAEVALLALAGALGDPPLLASARRAADALLSRAERDRYGLSWPSSAMKGERNLLGLSHGAAGVACALLEAFAATGETAYRAAALDAFAYERAWFDPLAQNWPTLLSARAKATPRQARRLPRMNYWCHGAPGAALARIRAYELLGLPAFGQEARAALDTTAAALEAIADVRLDNFSLCHGLAGIAAILLEGFSALPAPRDSWRDLANRVARAGLEVHASPADWLCGTRAYGAPGLMIGVAGIGMFYLRLYDENVPSMLLIRPGRIAERLTSAGCPCSPAG